jgi:hypothetical protein
MIHEWKKIQTLNNTCEWKLYSYEVKMPVICNKMKIIDISDPERINRLPDKSLTIFSGENFSEHGYKIKKVELRLFIEKNDEKLGQYSLITSLVDTDKGSIEMIYLEGYHGENPLESSKDFLVSTLGISGLILRSIIALESASKTD